MVKYIIFNIIYMKTRKNRKVKKGGRTKNNKTKNNNNNNNNKSKYSKNNINNLVKKLSSIANRNVTTLKKNIGLNEKNKKSSFFNIFS